MCLGYDSCVTVKISLSDEKFALSFYGACQGGWCRSLGYEYLSIDGRATVTDNKL